MHFDERIKELRESHGFLQRHWANLEIDTPMFSKIERSERMEKIEQIEQLAELLHADKPALFSIWLADQILDLIKN